MVTRIRIRNQNIKDYYESTSLEEYLRALNVAKLVQRTVFQTSKTLLDFITTSCKIYTMRDCNPSVLT